MSNEFLEFVNKLMDANPDLTKSLMTDSIQNYLTVLADKKEKPVLTENGKAILIHLKENFSDKPFKSADLAESMGISARGVSGSLRKLVSDGFCNKTGKDPIVYELTEKGRNFIIINEE